ncbi:hypothetical protein [Rhodococcus sp. B10]|uniref:hypothetical protein n=1 Tax=Rhodococcus sp. B10 TaxID=2695876 RepID=UPI00143074D6|nr:hypothetical protein [Rhodococcus sp. B10]NIL77661.1 hypothetical protein [Rhodococcus sp. B10]
MSSPVRYQPVATPAAPRTSVSQATAIEQSRAVAEVQAAVLVAQQNRRSKPLAVDEMRDTTHQKAVAEKAFFRYSRGGNTVTGPSVHLARELARCWGNIQYGVTELRRDDEKGESEMQAYAWDLETNARNSTTFIVPHKRDKTGGAVKLTDMRDIYENNANAGARRVREAILSVLPSWFVEEAKDLCNATLQDGGGVPIATRIANSVGHFETIGISLAQLEAKVGSKRDAWTEHDLSALGVTFRSLKNGEVTKEEEFPPIRLSAESIKAEAEKNKPAADKAEKPAAETQDSDPAEKPDEPKAPDVDPNGPVTEQQGRDLNDQFKAIKLTRWADRFEWLKGNGILDEDVKGINGLTAAQAQAALDAFAEPEQPGEPA